MLISIADIEISNNGLWKELLKCYLSKENILRIRREETWRWEDNITKYEVQFWGDPQIPIHTTLVFNSLFTTNIGLSSSNTYDSGVLKHTWKEDKTSWVFD